MLNQLNQVAKGTSPVIVVSSENFQSIFFSLALKRWRELFQYRVQTIDLEASEPAHISSQLNVSFLGEKIVYWCGSLDVLDAKKRAWFIAYSSQYTGPHIILYFTQDVRLLRDNEQCTVIQFPNELGIHEYEGLQVWCYPHVHSQPKFVKHLFKEKSMLSLDQACIMMSYQQVIGSNMQDFFDMWLEKILSSEHSLFTLSEYFFGKQKKLFLHMWDRVAREYPDQFWIAYWSEQVWRAACYIFLQQQKQPNEAKKITYRLPFSFINKDWRRHSYEHLQKAHDALANVDFQLKNDATMLQLETWYINFFA